MTLVQQRPAPADRSAAVLDDREPQAQRPAPVRPAWLYTAALQPADEPQRLSELRGFGILDTEPDEDYDRYKDYL